jgi:hypothetical protein
MSKKFFTKRLMTMETVKLPAASIGDSEIDEKYQSTPPEEREEVHGYQFGLYELGSKTPFAIEPNMYLAKAAANAHQRTTGMGVEVRDMKNHTFYYKIAPKGLHESADEGFPMKRPFDKVLLSHGFKVEHPNGVVSPNKLASDPMKHATLVHRWTNPNLGSKTHIETWMYRDGDKTWIGRFEQPNGILSPSTGSTAPQLDKAIAYWEGRR